MPEQKVPHIHLIFGATGAGKSTYAVKLAETLPGVRFSIDEWMNRLFWMDAPATQDGTWAMARVERCTAQMRNVIAELARTGAPAVVDAGLTTKVDRAAFTDWAESQGLTCRLHWLDVAPNIRWTRVGARNDGGGGTGFEVTREMFDFMENLWEPPTDEEMMRHDGVRIGD
jgi:predicted kinase